MTQSVRWTSADLALFPDDGKRFEVIDGKLHVAKAPHAYHQGACARIVSTLDVWDQRTGLGRTFVGPGVIFSPENVVIPDIAWIRRDRLAAALDSAGHLRAAPDLVVEVLSPGTENEQRDRQAKLKLYSVRGVLEYWIVDWRLRLVEVYRRSDLALSLVGTLREADTLISPIPPDFRLPLEVLFADMPIEQ
jgi:Uma2 family endonuclease